MTTAQEKTSISELRRLIRDFFRTFGAKVKVTPETIHVDLTDKRKTKKSQKSAEIDTESEESPSQDPKSTTDDPETASNTDSNSDSAPEDSATEATEADPTEQTNPESEADSTEDQPPASDEKAPEDGSEEAPAAPTRTKPASDLERLAEAFGKTKLNLVFQQEHLVEGTDLVVEGGHILRIMEAFLGEQGRRSYVICEANHRLTQKTIKDTLDLADGVAVEAIDREPTAGWDFYFLYKLNFRGRQRKDELRHVCVQIRKDKVQKIKFIKRLPGLKKMTWKARKKPPELLLNTAYNSACKAVKDECVDAALAFRDQSRDQINKDILRIKAFYSGRIRELMGNKTPTEKARNRIIELEEEQTRKIHEQLRAIKVQVDINPVQLLVIERPMQDAAIKLQQDQRNATIHTTFDRTSGKFHWPESQKQITSAKQLSLCHQSHVSPLNQISYCQCPREVCADCVQTRCFISHDLLCPQCEWGCQHCGESVATQYKGHCPVCKDDRCHECLSHCRSCEAVFCQACARDRDSALCRDCGAVCAATGAVYLISEMQKCTTCGRQFGPDSMHDHGVCILCQPVQEQPENDD